jgi:threonine dehydrogenase-like Zn-dependent dehydrogenase
MVLRRYGGVVRAVKAVEGAVEVVEQPPPVGEGLTVQIASAGICGSDLHLLQWGVPVVLGHEMAGTLADGTAVAVEPLDPCWRCPACMAGAHNLCERGASMVYGVGRDGGMAEKCLVPEAAISRLPAGLPPTDACLVEPLAVAVHGVRRGNVRAGQQVAVIGGGTIGQLAVVAVRASGAAVALEARHDRQLEVSRELGAHAVSDGYDVVLEAAGTASALKRAVEVCRPGGTVVLLGTHWDPPVMPATDISMKEVTLVPSYMYGRVGPSRDFDTAVSLLAGHPEVAALVISHRFPLDAAADAFETARDRSAGAIKVVLEP